MSYVTPIHEYQHSQPGGGCSVIGGHVYRGCAIPDLKGTYFFGDYCSARIWSFRYDGNTLTEFKDRGSELDPGSNIKLITSFGEDARGELYIITIGGDIWKIAIDPRVKGRTHIIQLVDQHRDRILLDRLQVGDRHR